MCLNFTYFIFLLIVIARGTVDITVLKGPRQIGNNINNTDNSSMNNNNGSISNSSSISNDRKNNGSFSSSCSSDENVQNIVISVTKSYLKDTSDVTSVTTAVAATVDEIQVVKEISSHQQSKVADKVIDIIKIDTIKSKEIVSSSPPSSPSSSTPNDIREDILVMSEVNDVAGYESFIIPQGHVWLSGDNKSNSTDSR